MANELKDLLEKEVHDEIEKLSSLKPGSDEHKQATDDIVKLYGKYIEHNKADSEFDSQMNREDLDLKRYRAEIEKMQSDLEERRKDRKTNTWIRIGEIVVPASLYAILMFKGFKFEETGTITSTFFRNVISKFKPK